MRIVACLPLSALLKHWRLRRRIGVDYHHDETYSRVGDCLAGNKHPSKSGNNRVTSHPPLWFPFLNVYPSVIAVKLYSAALSHRLDAIHDGKTYLPLDIKEMVGRIHALLSGFI